MATAWKDLLEEFLSDFAVSPSRYGGLGRAASIPGHCPFSNSMPQIFPPPPPSLYLFRLYWQRLPLTSTTHDGEGHLAQPGVKRRAYANSLYHQLLKRLEKFGQFFRLTATHHESAYKPDKRQELTRCIRQNIRCIHWLSSFTCDMIHPEGDTIRLPQKVGVCIAWAMDYNELATRSVKPILNGFRYCSLMLKDITWTASKTPSFTVSLKHIVW